MSHFCVKPKCYLLKNNYRPAKQTVKEKTIPNEILGIKAIAPAPDMAGTLDWLKTIRIHKYWSFFSHLNYKAMISLNDENLDLYLQECGAKQSFFPGTRKKILKSIKELRTRGHQLGNLDPADEELACYVISKILKTPICDYAQEEDGTYLTGLLKQKITQIVDAARKRGEWSIFIKLMLEEYIKNKCITEYDKICAKQWLKYNQLNFPPIPVSSSGLAQDKLSILSFAKSLTMKTSDYNNNCNNHGV